jgi:3-hydroxy-9,10-secoandrosta-1,3,5(10)-triene-9,17-dione monooxygenase
MSTTVSREEMLERAKALVPVLRERSAKCEELRRIPQETIDDLVNAGIVRMAQPPRFGGLGFGVDAVTDLALEVGRGCPSTAWMTGQWAGHNFMVGYFREEAQEEYFADSPDTMSSTASAVARLEMEEVKGGLQVSAQMRFSSGCDAADWILLFTPPLGMSLVPKADFRVEDDWHVMGLRGTGSKSVVLDDVFIPEYRTVPLEALATGRSYGAEIYPDNPWYRVPMMPTLNTLLLAATIGMARGVLDIVDERVKSRVDLHTFKPTFERPGVQLRFAEACAEVDTAVLLLHDILAGLEHWGRQEELMPPLEFARLRRNVAYSAKLCLQAADRLLEYGDASGMYEPQPLQRWGRDVHMAGLQYMLTWDEPALAYSQRRWGLEPDAFTS